MSDAKYLIAHIEHTEPWCSHITWWKPDSRGYTVCIDKAGLYDEVSARGICTASSGTCIAVEKDVAEAVSRSTPYHRLPGGMLGAVYDGGPHKVVPNSKHVWKEILPRRLPTGSHTKPRPFWAPSTIIYLPDGFTLSEAQK